MAKITLGEKASVFHDPYTGVTLKPGDVVDVTGAQMRAPKIRAALNGGHLVLFTGTKEKEEKVDKEAAVSKFKELMAKKADAKALKKALSMGEIKAIAESMDITPEDGDTKEVLLTVILEEYSDGNGNEGKPEE